MKVPDGKLLIIKADDSVENVKVQGDFFIYPEETLELIEDALSNTKQEMLKEVLKDVVKEGNIEMVGVTIEAICELMDQIYEEVK